MAVVLVNFASRAFVQSQRLNALSGEAIGRCDRVESFGPRDIDRRFRRRNPDILGNGRGAGLWLWKPYFVHRVLRDLDEGDWLFYSDSGALFIDSVHPLVDFASERDLDVLAFELLFLERQYTKRDTFLLLGCDEPRFADTRQRLASFSLWRASSSALSLAQKWLAVAQDERALTDLDNCLGKPNYPGWIEHRYDQSIFSLLTKKAGMPAFRDPSQFGMAHTADYPDSTYPTALHHTRARANPSAPFGDRLRRTVVRRAHDLRRGRLKDALSSRGEP